MQELLLKAAETKKRRREKGRMKNRTLIYKKSSSLLGEALFIAFPMNIISKAQLNFSAISI